MYLIVAKNDNSNRIVNMGNLLDYMSNGYPRLIDKNVAFPDWMVHVYEVNLVSPEIVPDKYCYTEKDGFYLNPDYIEPDQTNIYGIPDNVYHAIIDDYTAELFGGEE